MSWLFLEEAERFFKENQLRLNLYCIANNGFIEGKQNEPLMQVLENFCSRAGVRWCGGGVGIGGGVMLNVTRIIFMVQTAVFIVLNIINGIKNGVFLDMGILSVFLKNVGLLLFFLIWEFYSF